MMWLCKKQCLHNDEYRSELRLCLWPVLVCRIVDVCPNADRKVSQQMSYLLLSGRYILLPELTEFPLANIQRQLIEMNSNEVTYLLNEIKTSL